MLDPHASEIVYRANPYIHHSFDTDLTMHVTLPAKKVRQHFTGSLPKPVLDFTEVWFAKTEILTFHDHLAGNTIFDDRICEFLRG
jgi:hypothetical protein